MKCHVVSLLVIFIILFESCGGKKDNHISNGIEGREHIISRAERFTLEKKSGWTRIKIINPWQGAIGVNQTYYLLKRGSVIPAGIDSLSVIFVPVQNIICMSSTHVAMISALGEEKSLTGVSGADLIYSPAIIKNIKKGLIADVGYEASLNKEMILKISPDLIMIYGIGGESAGYLSKIKELGVKVIINADYLENDPLGRAEWIKLFGALYCKENLADSLFKSEVAKYTELKLFLKKNVTKRPKVILGLPFKDTWYISPGNSYISNLISDAGGDYLWSDTNSSVSMPYGIENVFLKGLTADYWLNTGTAGSRNEILSIDQRLAEFACFKKDNLFNNNKRMTPSGGNDYWESGTLNPHLLLKDIAAILHPGLFDNYELTYYRKIF